MWLLVNIMVFVVCSFIQPWNFNDIDISYACAVFQKKSMWNNVFMNFPCKKNAYFNAVSVNAEMTNNRTSQCTETLLQSHGHTLPAFSFSGHFSLWYNRTDIACWMQWDSEIWFSSQLRSSSTAAWGTFQPRWNHIRLSRQATHKMLICPGGHRNGWSWWCVFPSFSQRRWSNSTQFWWSVAVFCSFLKSNLRELTVTKSTLQHFHEKQCIIFLHKFVQHAQSTYRIMYTALIVSAYTYNKNVSFLIRGKLWRDCMWRMLHDSETLPVKEGNELTLEWAESLKCEWLDGCMALNYQIGALSWETD